MPLSGVMCRYIVAADEQREPFDIYGSCEVWLLRIIETVSIRMQYSHCSTTSIFCQQDNVGHRGIIHKRPNVIHWLVWGYQLENSLVQAIASNLPAKTFL